MTVSCWWAFGRSRHAWRDTMRAYNGNIALWAVPTRRVQHAAPAKSDGDENPPTSQKFSTYVDKHGEKMHKSGKSYPQLWIGVGKACESPHTRGRIHRVCRGGCREENGVKMCRRCARGWG